MKVILPPAIDRLSPREKRLLAAGSVCVLAFGGYMLMPGEEAPGVELAQAPANVTAPAATVIAPTAPPPAPTPLPPPAGPAAVAPPVALATGEASAQGYVLRGVFGGGPRGGAAILTVPGGQERRVPIGREIAPGVRLKAVGLSHAVITGPGGDQRLELSRNSAAAPGAPQ